MDEELQKAIDDRLRAQGLTDNDLREIERNAQTVKDARDAAIAKAVKEHGADYGLVLEVTGMLFGMMAAAAQAQHFISDEDKPKVKMIYDTMIRLVHQVATELCVRFNLSPDDMTAIYELSMAVTDATIKNATDFVPERERKEAA